MKIEIYDISHIITQIKCASPPKTKEDHKLLNNLAILLEKNSIKKESDLENKLNESLEKMNENFLDLCFLRKEIVKKFSVEFSESMNEMVEKLINNRNIFLKSKDLSKKTIDWNLETSCDSAFSLIPEIFGKLNKSKEIIQDCMETTNYRNTDADSYIEACLNSL